ncbi:hypothetical protein [Aurantiacibacter odishensis]|uniref:hypothetical protein n=1 Tax=Aurantiacibacter odishensis TaxID=1155476 RepID=UPI0013C4208C|nr:hypothetical protein [Aurantiacibacter odishensis]
MSDATALAEAAQQMVGAPFRLLGRDPGTGVDCIGLVYAALARIGRTPPAVPRYAMRNLDLAHFARLLPAAGLVPHEGGTRPGDVVLLRPSTAQFHLAIVGPRSSLIHAHAGLGRVVESPAPLPWPVVARWRLTGN